ncbi:hypothetical protein KI387_023414, partial [Taxus chinensis]
MGQLFSLSQGRCAFSVTDRSVESSVRSRETSFRISSSRSSSFSTSGSVMGSRRGLDLDKKVFLCRSVREDPNGYSSRVYYRSNAGEGVPFQWEAQPGKPKNCIVQDALNALPLSPPPSLESKKHRKRKSRKNHSRFAGFTCTSFNMMD